MKTINKLQKKPQTLSKSKKAKIESKTTRVNSQVTAMLNTRKTKIADSLMKDISYACAIARVCIMRLQNAVLTTEYYIKTKKDADPKGYTQQIEYIENLLSMPNANDDTFRTLFSKTLEDIATTRMGGVIEKVRNPKGEVVELYHVDATTIKPCIDDYGQFEEVAYKQYLEGNESSPDAEFSKDDLLIFQLYPLGGKNTGTQTSIVDNIIGTIIAQVQAVNFNSSYFNSSQIPPGIFNLAGADATALKALKESFENAMQANQHAVAFTSAETLSYEKLRPTNQDMQYYEWNMFLVKVIVSAFGLSIQDIGMTEDVNRATAEVQQDTSKSYGVKNFLSVIQEEMNVDLLRDLADVDPKFKDIEFRFKEVDQIDEKTQAEINAIKIKSGEKTVNEIRKENGDEPLEEDETEVEVDMGEEEEMEEPVTKSIKKDSPFPADFSDEDKSNIKWELFYQ
jgi:HK97 family phage portal protein